MIFKVYELRNDVSVLINWLDSSENVVLLIIIR